MRGLLILGVLAFVVFYWTVVAPDVARTCTEAGGRYIGHVYAPDECWTPDGARRLFPAPYFN